MLGKHAEAERPRHLPHKTTLKFHLLIFNLTNYVRNIKYIPSFVDVIFGYTLLYTI